MLSIAFGILAMLSAQVACPATTVSVGRHTATIWVPDCDGNPGFHIVEKLYNLPKCARHVGAWLDAPVGDEGWGACAPKWAPIDGTPMPDWHPLKRW